MKVVIATNNKHKVEEIETALDFPGWEFLTLSQVESYPEPEEDADTFVGNELIKARAAHEATGMAALADDSGLVVDALDGRPGVYSARYAGTHGDDAANNAKVVAELEGVPDEQRTGRVCARIHQRGGRRNDGRGHGRRPYWARAARQRGLWLRPHVHARGVWF